MKRVTLLCGLLLALSATVAAAAPGVGLRWGACLSDAGAINRNFACNTNAGANNTLVGTFETNAAGLGAVSGNEVVIDIASAGSTLPAWWSMKNPGTCRQASISMNFVPPGTAANCTDWGVGQSAGGIGAYNIGQRGANTTRIVAAIAVPANQLQDLVGGQEYFSFNVVINNLKTVGTGNCAGCDVPVCLVFNSCNLTTPILANNVKMTGPSNGTDGNFATWQGGGGVGVPPGPWGPGGSGCPAATPTKSATWSQVKSLYR